MTFLIVLSINMQKLVWKVKVTVTHYVVIIVYVGYNVIRNFDIKRNFVDAWHIKLVISYIPMMTSYNVK